jgi:hypothetical protein
VSVISWIKGSIPRNGVGSAGTIARNLNFSSAVVNSTQAETDFVLTWCSSAMIASSLTEEKS